MGRLKDITGQNFGKLTVLFQDRTKTVKYGYHAHWICRCNCGTIKSINGRSLRTGKTVSCSCNTTERNKKRKIHGHSNGHSSRKDNLSKTYTSFRSMKARCYNENHENYFNYGGRGIKICERWINSFVNFLSDMGERPEGKTIDRIDVNADYSPENCRWATASEQQLNQRRYKKS